MFEISKIINKPIIRIKSPQIIGYVKHIVFNVKLKKIQYLVINNKCEYKIIHINNILKITEDSLILKNNYLLLDYSLIWLNSEDFATLINCEAYGKNGKYLGSIKQIETDKLKITKIKTNLNEEILKSEILCFSNNLLIKKTSSSTNKFERIFDIANKANQKVIIQKNNNFNMNNLINKKLMQNVFYNNEIIFKTNTKITAQNLRTAITLGLLPEIIKYCEK